METNIKKIVAWSVVGLFALITLLCSYYTITSSTSSTDINSYEVYANGMIYQYGTFDNGSTVRTINADINYLIPFVTKSYVTNFVPLAPTNQQYYVGSIGARNQTTPGIRMSYYGTTPVNDVAQYLKWETRGF